jgi:hypothetical protein
VRGQGKALRLDHAGSGKSRRDRCDFGSSTTDPPVDRHPALPDVQRRPLGGEIDVGPPPVTRGVGRNIMSDRRRGTGARRREGDEGGRVARTPVRSVLTLSYDW